MKNYIFVCLFLLIQNSIQWGDEGHIIVAYVAQNYLTKTAAEGIADSLQGSYLNDIATWADSYRGHPDGKWSGPLHYCNLPRDATEFKMDYCPENCVVKAINSAIDNIKKNKNEACANDDPPCNLANLVHFIGDIHQPLHVSYEDDRGGNEVKVNLDGKHTNLHAVWDSGILDHWDSKAQAAAQELIKMADDNTVQKYSASKDPIEWADESFQAVLNTVYKFEGDNLGDDYIQANLPIVQQRLLAAGIRLADVLNDIYGSN